MRRSSRSILPRVLRTLVVFAVGGTLSSVATAAALDTRPSTSTPVQAPTTTGLVNPWAAGDAAVRQYFEQLGREQFTATTTPAESGCSASRD